MQPYGIQSPFVHNKLEAPAKFCLKDIVDLQDNYEREYIYKRNPTATVKLPIGSYHEGKDDLNNKIQSQIHLSLKEEKQRKFISPYGWYYMIYIYNTIKGHTAQQILEDQVQCLDFFSNFDHHVSHILEVGTP